jgi:hypothetical protein
MARINLHRPDRVRKHHLIIRAFIFFSAFVSSAADKPTVLFNANEEGRSCVVTIPSVDPKLTCGSLKPFAIPIDRSAPLQLQVLNRRFMTHYQLRYHDAPQNLETTQRTEAVHAVRQILLPVAPEIVPAPLLKRQALSAGLLLDPVSSNELISIFKRDNAVMEARSRSLKIKLDAFDQHYADLVGLENQQEAHCAINNDALDLAKSTFYLLQACLKEGNGRALVTSKQSTKEFNTPETEVEFELLDRHVRSLVRQANILNVRLRESTLVDQGTQLRNEIEAYIEDRRTFYADADTVLDAIKTLKTIPWQAASDSIGTRLLLRGELATLLKRDGATPQFATDAERNVALDEYIRQLGLQGSVLRNEVEHVEDEVGQYYVSGKLVPSLVYELAEISDEIQQELPRLVDQINSDMRELVDLMNNLFERSALADSRDFPLQLAEPTKQTVFYTVVRKNDFARYYFLNTPSSEERTDSQQPPVTVSIGSFEVGAEQRRRRQ